MTEIERMLERQAEWQKSRQSLTWPEKIRLAERVRDTIRQLRTQPRPTMPEPPPKRSTV
jgi:hypothetical protein